MTNKNILLTFIGLVGAVLVGSFLVARPTTQPIVGANPGTDFYNHTSFLQGATFGGAVSTTTTGATQTTVVNDFRQTPTVISWNPNLNTTISLSSTSTFPYIPNVGDTATIYIRNASTTAGATMTFAALDANVDLQFAEATGGDLVLNGLDWAKVTLIHTSTYLVTVIFDEMTEAD